MQRRNWSDLDILASNLQPSGHAIQARVYAEDPDKDFQPCAGLLSEVTFPESKGLRIDHWLETGIEVSPLFDPMLAKVIVHAKDRNSALAQLDAALAKTVLYGIETNIHYVREVLKTDVFKRGEIYTRYLNDFHSRSDSFDVLSPGTLTTIQDYPARTGYWNVGVPPSGPFDQYSFNIGNRLLDNAPDAAGLEITLNGPVLRFKTDTQIVLTGATMVAHLDDVAIDFWKVIDVKAGQTLKVGKTTGHGARAYCCIKGGIVCPIIWAPSPRLRSASSVVMPDVRYARVMCCTIMRSPIKLTDSAIAQKSLFPRSAITGPYA